MEYAKELATRFFENELEFSVKDIPETDAKRADLDVNDGDQQYLVEVKEKLDTGSQLTTLNLSHEGHDRKITREPHAPSNRLSGIMRSGRKQLESTPAANDTIRLILLYFTGPNADMLARRTLYTFYGVQDVIPDDGGGGLNCVYFHNSFGFSSPTVDGIIIIENDGLNLCLNEFGHNYGRLQNSQMAEKLKLGIYDPANFESDGGKLVLRSTVNRKHETDVLNALEQQTGKSYHTMTLNRYNL